MNRLNPNADFRRNQDAALHRLRTEEALREALIHGTDSYGSQEMDDSIRAAMKKRDAQIAKSNNLKKWLGVAFLIAAMILLVILLSGMLGLRPGE
jgi:hypothetical protein